MSENIHATCICLQKKGILLLGESGAGKSDLALRLIMEYGASLVADDRVNITVTSRGVKASAPKVLQNMLEVRGIGIITLSACKSAHIRLAVELTDKKLERLPEPYFYSLCGTQIPCVKLNPFEVSTPAKVLAALSLL